MKKINSHAKRNAFLYLDHIQIQNQKKKLSPQFHSVHDEKPEIVESREHVNTSLVPIHLSDRQKITNLSTPEQTVKPPINPNDFFINVLMHQTGMREFFNIEEVGTEEEVHMALGTYDNLIKQAGAQGIAQEVLDHGFDIKSAQNYALLQIYLKTEDAHGENILIRIDQNHHLIPTPLNCSRWLCDDPNSEKMIPRTTRWERWPALNQPICEPIKDFVIDSDPEFLVEQMKLDFLKQCGPYLSDEQKSIFETRFYHLKCNMIMVKEAVSEGLYIKQILALILPVIDDFAFKFVTQGILKGGELWPARKRYISLHTGFRTAWNKAKKEGGRRTEIFTERIRQEISEIKKLPSETLESNYFRELCYELRKGLFL